jgi:hypothetical protein
MPWSKTARSLPITRISPHQPPARPSPPHDPDESKLATDTMDTMTSQGIFASRAERRPDPNLDRAREAHSPVASTLGLRSPSRVSTLASRCRAEVDAAPDLRALRDRILADLYPKVTHPLVARPPSPVPDDASF